MTQYFGGTTSHNTIQFDGRDQMPRLSRFLFSHWLKAEDISFSHEQRGAALASASYKDSQGACHFRQLELESNNLQVLDKVSNFKRSAVLRWRLDSSDWVINGLVISNGKQRIIISSTVPIARFEIVQGWESLYYLQKKELPVLEVEINQAGELKTEIQFIA